MSDLVIRAEKLTKIYQLYSRPEYRLLDMLGLLRNKQDRVSHHPAVDGIDLEVRRGEKVGIIGRNGAGKSTLLKLITGVIEPTAGTIEVAGNTHALLQIGTGFHPDFTGRQNALSYLASYGIRGKEAERHLRDIVEFAEIETYIDQPVKTYSTGMAVRLMFASSTAIVPEILILDEVLSVGDAYFAHKSFERIRDMTDSRGSTLLIVSHDVDRTMMLCNRLIWIDGGRVRMDGDAKEVANRYALSIREQEEQRLRQRRVEAVRQETTPEQEATADIAFAQLRRKGGLPIEASLPIASIRLTGDGTEICRLDTDPNAPSRNADLLLQAGEANWSEVEQVHGRTVRSFARHGSIFQRVAFLIPDGAALVTDLPLECSVEIFDSHAAMFLLEVFPDPGKPTCFRGEFATEGSGTWKTLSVPATFTGEAEPASGKMRLGSQRMSIDKVTFLNERGEETRIFRVGGRMEIVFHYTINDPTFRSRPVVQAAFQRDGVRLARMVLDNHLFDAAKRQTGELRAAFDPLRLGPGEYVVNVAVMSEGGYEGEPAYYTANHDILDHHTRAYTIKIEKTGMRLVDTVAFMPEATWTVDGVSRTGSYSIPPKESWSHGAALEETAVRNLGHEEIQKRRRERHRA